MSKMTLSRPHPRTPPYPENTVLVQGPTHPQISGGELLSYRVALQGGDNLMPTLVELCGRRSWAPTTSGHW